MSLKCYALVIVLAGGLIMFGLRALPFLLFRGKQLGGTMKFWGAVLAPASIGMLVIYCLKDAVWMPLQFCPEFYAVVLVVLIQWFCRQMWISICAGTIFYIIIHPIFITG